MTCGCTLGIVLVRCSSGLGKQMQYTGGPTLAVTAQQLSCTEGLVMNCRCNQHRGQRPWA